MSARKRLASDIAGLEMGRFDTEDDGAASGDFTKAKKRREVDTDEIQLCEEGRSRSASLSPHLDCCGGQDQDMEECTKFLPIRDALLRSLHHDDHSRAAACSIEGKCTIHPWKQDTRKCCMLASCSCGPWKELGMQNHGDTADWFFCWLAMAGLAARVSSSML
jgi:hypothetical protein